MPASPFAGGFKMPKRGNCNATTSKLEVEGNLWRIYDNGSPRYSVRTTMLSLVPSLKFPTCPTCKISIPLLLLSCMCR